jgi:hypothetical protein
MPTPREIIGESQRGDYRLDPAGHAELYKDTPLAAVLLAPRIESIATLYQTANDEAGALQTAYKRVIGLANLLILLAAALGAAMMAAQILYGAPAGEAPKPPASYVVGGLGLLSGIVGAVAAGCLFWVKSGGKLQAWMARRAAAEGRRLAYFLAVVTPVEPPNPLLDALRLYYFRRYHLVLQCTYFDTRGGEHRAAADRMLAVGAVAAIAASLASLGTGGASFANTAAVAFGALGIIAAALSSFASNSEATSQDRRNGERYRATHEVLVELSARLGTVEEELAAGNREATLAYVKVVNEQLAAEHKQWLAVMEGSEAVVAKLESALAATREEARKPPPAVPVAAAPQAPVGDGEKKE